MGRPKVEASLGSTEGAFMKTSIRLLIAEVVGGGLVPCTFGHLLHIWHSTRIHPAFKFCLLNSSVLLYGSETWSPFTDWSRRLDTYHRAYLRSIPGIWLFFRDVYCILSFCSCSEIKKNGGDLSSLSAHLNDTVACR